MFYYSKSYSEFLKLLHPGNFKELALFVVIQSFIPTEHYNL